MRFWLWKISSSLHAKANKNVQLSYLLEVWFLKKRNGKNKNKKINKKRNRILREEVGFDFFFIHIILLIGHPLSSLYQGRGVDIYFLFAYPVTFHVKFVMQFPTNP